jgi:hypothetical protein
VRIRPQDDEAFDVLVVERDRAVHAVGELGRAGRHLEPDRAAIFERLSGVEQLPGRGAITIETLRLEIRPMRTADLRAFVPVDPQPAQAVEDAGHHFRL